MPRFQPDGLIIRGCGFRGYVQKTQSSVYSPGQHANLCSDFPGWIQWQIAAENIYDT